MKIFSGIFPVCYGQFYFLSNNHWAGDLRGCFSNQHNGLCGTATQGVVSFITGLHTGNITLNVNFYDKEPVIDFTKDEIVEVSFSIETHDINLEAWGGELKQSLNLPIGDYRIRYYAKNFALAEEEGEYDSSDIEFYDIDIWPSPTEPDKIIKITSESARYWHNEFGSQ